jgi:hypothetical protein
MIDYAILVNALNSNKVLWGLSMLMLNFGARYVVADLGKAHEIILSHEITKKLIVLCLFFVATRDILMSFILTVAYIVVVDGILHEKKRFCLVPKGVIEKATSTVGYVSQDDYLRAKNIIERFEAKRTSNTEINDLNNKSLYMNYINNVKAATLS